MKTDDKEMDIAEKLIGNLTAAFDPSKYTDTYREALRRIIDDRIAGRQVVAQPEAPESNVIDLMEALKASVERTEQEKKQGKPRSEAPKRQAK
jgi:DNA end-binding protein Ku